MSGNKVRRIVIWAAVGLAAAVVLVLLLAPDPVPVDMAAVRRGPLQVVLEHEGVTRAREPFTISAPVRGRVLRIELEPGDPVAARQTVLATFLPSQPVPLDARSRARAEAALRSVREELDRARAERDRARAQHDLAAAEYERILSLEQRGVASRQELDAAEADARTAGETLAAADAGVRAARQRVERAAAALLEPDDRDGGGGGAAGAALVIRSPVDGVVLRRLRRSEAVVGAGEALLEVADLSQLEVAADFLSTDAARMRPGMRARITRWGGDHRLEGRVRRIEPSGFLKLSALGVEEQRVWVIVDFEGPIAAREALGDGYRVEVGVVVYDTDDALKIPTGSLFRNSGAWAAYAVRDGEARLVELELGKRNDLEAEVLSGLEDGDRVVVHPPDRVRDGVRVEARSTS
jgi:HlyD family secretion protein